MKRNAVLPALLIAAAVTAAPLSAQNTTPDREAMAEQMQARMAEAKERLNLTEEQSEQVEIIFQENAEKRAEIMEEADLDGSRNFRKMRKLRGQMKDLDKETTAQLADVLNEEQMAEYERIKEENRAEMRERMQNRRDSQQ